jgi:hypothetical protein
MAKDQKQASSQFNLQTVTTDKLYDHLRGTIAYGGNAVVVGRRGSGKTQISKSAIRSSGCKEIYINISTLERVDLGGYPDIMGAGVKRDFVDFLLPKFYEPMIVGDQPCVALLDEVDKADPSLLAPLLEFTQFHRINNRELPNLRSIIMTGNLIAEGGSRPSLPLMDRAEKYLAEANVTDWVSWAGREGKIHPSITSFILDNPADLFGTVDPEDRYSDPSPRGWENASKIINVSEKEKFGWSADFINEKVSACVGRAAGLKYSAYFNHYMKLLPLIEKVFAGEKVTAEYKALNQSEKLVSSMIACTRLTSKLEDLKTAPTSVAKLPAFVGHVGNFLSEVTYENVLIAVRSQVTVARIIKFKLDEHPAWKSVLETVSNTAK